MHGSESLNQFNLTFIGAHFYDCRLCLECLGVTHSHKQTIHNMIHMAGGSGGRNTVAV